MVIVMFVETAGNPSGPPMLLLHGMLSSNAQWDLNRDELGEHFSLHLVELPGHGRSAAYDDPAHYAPDHLLAELEQIREDAGIERWWVCGQSLGGAVAIRYCLTYPERALGLIFTNSRAAFGVSRSARIANNTDAADSPAPRVTRDLPMHPSKADRLPQPLKDRLIAAADAVQMTTFHDFGARMNQWQSADDLEHLRLPVLLVNGRWEKRFQQHVPEARSKIAGLDVVDLEGGHAINAERADEFNAAVLRFVRENAPSH